MKTAQNGRNLIAWILVNQSGEFRTEDVPKHLRKSLSGLVGKEFLKSKRDGPETRIYQITEAGKFYALRYADSEVKQAIGAPL